MCSWWRAEPRQPSNTPGHDVEQSQVAFSSRVVWIRLTYTAWSVKSSSTAFSRSTASSMSLRLGRDGQLTMVGRREEIEGVHNKGVYRKVPINLGRTGSVRLRFRSLPPTQSGLAGFG